MMVARENYPVLQGGTASKAQEDWVAVIRTSRPV